MCSYIVHFSAQTLKIKNIRSAKLFYISEKWNFLLSLILSFLFIFQETKPFNILGRTSKAPKLFVTIEIFGILFFKMNLIRYYCFINIYIVYRNRTFILMKFIFLNFSLIKFYNFLSIFIYGFILFIIFF